MAGRKVDFPGQETSQEVPSGLHTGSDKVSKWVLIGLVPIAAAGAAVPVLEVRWREDEVEVAVVVLLLLLLLPPGCHSTIRILVPKSLNSNLAKWSAAVEEGAAAGPTLGAGACAAGAEDRGGAVDGSIVGMGYATGGIRAAIFRLPLIWQMQLDGFLVRGDVIRTWRASRPGKRGREGRKEGRKEAADESSRTGRMKQIFRELFLQPTGFKQKRE